MKPEIHAEFAALIPPLTAEEYMQLEANLVKEGCRDPLVVWNGVLLDGHNRLRICTKHNIPYALAERECADRDDAKKYIILNQFGRRNLSVGDRSLLALQLEPIFVEQAKKNQAQSPGRGKKVASNDATFSAAKASREIARVAGVSSSTIERTKHIQTHGSPDHIRRIKTGGIGNSVYAVYNELREENQGTGVTDAPIPQSPSPQAASEPAPASDADNADDTDAATDEDTPLDEAAEAPPEEPKPAVNDLERIKRYVQDLKNPNIDRSFTPEMLVMEYEAFTERFVRSMSTFRGEPYAGLYPSLPEEARERLHALNAAMIRAIQQINKIV